MPLVAGEVIAADRPDPMALAVSYLKKTAPVLKPGEWGQDERGCVYNVKRTGDRISLEAAITTAEGAIVCK
jgi:hypothetical protein